MAQRSAAWDSATQQTGCNDFRPSTRNFHRACLHTAMNLERSVPTGRKATWTEPCAVAGAESPPSASDDRLMESKRWMPSARLIIAISMSFTEETLVGIVKGIDMGGEDLVQKEAPTPKILQAVDREVFEAQPSRLYDGPPI